MVAEAHGGLGRGAGQCGLPEEEGPRSGPACGCRGWLCGTKHTHATLQPTAHFIETETKVQSRRALGMSELGLEPKC